MAVKYEVPEESYFRIHHIRPRFKNDVESVLIFMVSEIVKIPRARIEEFMENVNKAIRRYPGNASKTIKTINNWRTEISSLFGLIQFYGRTGECWPGAMSKNLSEKQDLVEFFKYFLYYFQYPGGHLKPHETLQYVKAGIKFKPAKYVLRLLSEAEKKTGGRFGITKAELTHCVFNDLGVTRDNRSVEEVVDLIIKNRGEDLGYDWSGDVIRYAGDILDYMVIANLLSLHGNKYYTNPDESESIEAFVASDLYFDKYDSLYEKKDLTIEDINAIQDDWFDFVNQKIEIDIFKTNVFRYSGIDESAYLGLEAVFDDFYQKISKDEEVRVKEIGDFGEFLIHGHESMRVKIGGREDLLNLIVRIPTAYAVGYDIQSVELDGGKRYVEVKTTISSKSLSFNNFHMTSNEWSTAETLDGAYFVYRLMISKEKRTLFIIQDPVGKYKSNLLKMVPREGADITFFGKSGKQEELLIWRS
jgi:hypothetical protein